MIEIFASPDKNMKQIRTELAAKRLHRALSVLTVGKDIHHNKRSGIISIDWKPVAKVEAKPNDDFSITWNAPILTDLGTNSTVYIANLTVNGTVLAISGTIQPDSDSDQSNCNTDRADRCANVTDRSTD